ncbi:MAG TPA: type II secretion system F family protein [Actinocrinis sp.]|nr:type II secretion system F family protein [Actinocrinis sp.]
MVLTALGLGFGYTVAGRNAAAKAAKAAERRVAAAPAAIELFAAGLTAGLLPEQAANAVVDAFGRAGPEADPEQDPLGHIAESFRRAAEILADTADLTLAWTVLQQDPATEPVGTAALRSSRTGAPLAEAVTRAARATRIASQQAAQGQVREVAVKAVAPLALCFLPAFILIGIVPLALGLLREFQR